jgi:hypothetical protein
MRTGPKPIQEATEHRSGLAVTLIPQHVEGVRTIGVVVHDALYSDVGLPRFRSTGARLGNALGTGDIRCRPSVKGGVVKVARMVGRGCVAALAMAAWGAAPAGAECVYAEVYVTREGDTPIWLLGENDPCIYATPWTWAVTDHGDLTRSGLPTGAPNGLHHDIRVPSPV